MVDRHVERAFSVRSDGTIAFYPFGRWADGYRATTAEQATALQAAMRRYVLFYLRFGLAFFAIMTSASFLLSDLLPSTATRLPVWVIAAGAFVFMLAPLAVLGAFLVIWQRRFRIFARDLEVLPPTFTQFPVVQSAAARVNRPSMVARAAVSFTFATIGLILLIWQERRLDRWETLLMSLGVVAGLGYYVWCRSVMRAEQAPGVHGHAEPAAPGDGKGRRGSA